MKKKAIIIATVLLALFAVGAVYALATEPRISGRGTSTLTITNPNPKNTKGKLIGELCVYYTHTSSGQKDSFPADYNLAGGEVKRVSAPTGSIIDGWSTLYCTVIEGEY